MAYKNFIHLTDQDIAESVDILEIMKALDPFAQQLILERVKGMKQMQDIMDKKTA